MSEVLDVSLSKIEFEQKSGKPVARVSFTMQAGIIQESVITLVLPWNGNLEDLQKAIGKTIRDLGTTLAKHPVLQSTEEKPK